MRWIINDVLIYIVIPAALTAVLVYLPWGFGRVLPLPF